MILIWTLFIHDALFISEIVFFKVRFLKDIFKINLGYQYYQCVTLALANCQAKSIKLQGDLSHLYVMSRSQKARLDIVTQIKFIHKFSTRSSSVFAVESPRCIWTRQRPFHFPWFMWLCNSSIQNIGACVPAYWLLVPSWQCLDALQLKLNTRY